MCKTNRKTAPILLSALVFAVLLGLGYAYQRHTFVQKANARYSIRNGKLFAVCSYHGPWVTQLWLVALIQKPIIESGPHCQYESGSITTNGMTLIIHASDGTFLIYAN